MNTINDSAILLHLGDLDWVVYMIKLTGRPMVKID